MAASGADLRSPVSLLDAVERGEFDAHLAEKNPSVNVLHFSTNGRLTPDVERLIRALHSRGFRVEGRVYDRAAFDERAEALATEMGEVHAVGPSPGEPSRRGFFRRLGDRLFGIPRFSVGLAFPFRPSQKLRSVRTRALMAGNTLLGLRLLAEGSFFYGVPTVVLNAWIFAYVSNAQELYRFKAQGAAVRLTDDGAITVRANQPAMGLATFIEETALTTLLRMSVGGVEAATGDPLGVAVDSALMAFAKSTTDVPIAELYRRAKMAEAEGDVELAAKLSARAETYQDLAYNLMIPALKFLQLPIPTADPTTQMLTLVARTASNGALFAIGLYGLVRESMKKFRTRPQDDARCATLLQFRSAL